MTRVALSDILLDRVKDKLYHNLRFGKLRRWDADYLSDIVDAAVEENRTIIANYVSEHEVNMQNLNERVKEIVNIVLAHMPWHAGFKDMPSPE